MAPLSGSLAEWRHCLGVWLSDATVGKCVDSAKDSYRIIGRNCWLGNVIVVYDLLRH